MASSKQNGEIVDQLRNERNVSLTRREMIGLLGIPAGTGLVSILGVPRDTPHMTQTQRQSVEAGAAIIRTLMADLLPSSLGGPVLFHEHLSFHPQGTTTALH